MTGRAKLFRNLGIGAAASIALVVLATIAIVQTDWFRIYIKQKITSATEDGTGGKVEIGSFAFDWRHLRSTVTDFVVHGSEPQGVAPYLRASRVELIIRPFTSIHHILDVTYLGIDRPEANIVVFPDGHTNVPVPKRSSSNQSPLETVIDLAVSHFELTNGLITFASEKQDLNVRGNHLQVQLWYNVADQGYRGQLSFEPLYVVSGRNTPVAFAVTLPVALERDRINFNDARITTSQSSILINGSVENLKDHPKISAHLNGQISFADLNNAGNLPLEIAGRGVPSRIDVDAHATAADNSIQVTGVLLGIGASNIEASGTLKDPRGEGALEFKSRLALGELGRLAQVSSRPEGIAILDGRAKLDTDNNYQITGNAQIRGGSFQEGGRQIGNVNLFSAVTFDPHELHLNGLRLSAFGGELRGDAFMQDFARYQLRGTIRNLSLQSAIQAIGERQFAYAGVVSGPVEASGDLRAAGSQTVMARARLDIAPGLQGTPLSGRLNA